LVAMMGGRSASEQGGFPKPLLTVLAFAHNPSR
jgi:hypothetical protein